MWIFYSQKYFQFHFERNLKKKLNFYPSRSPFCQYFRFLTFNILWQRFTYIVQDGTWIVHVICTYGSGLGADLSLLHHHIFPIRMTQNVAYILLHSFIHFVCGIPTDFAIYFLNRRWDSIRSSTEMQSLWRTLAQSR